MIHLATHGFFLDGRCAPTATASRGIGGLVSGTPRARSGSRPGNPLVLSGLVLAGANRRDVVAPGAEDGILMAEEIATLDLSGTEWAVLSACNTAIGEVRPGEGVFGLRRAFRVAGAGTVVMSLWPVQDAAAREWMRGLYEARLDAGLDTAQAVRRATLGALEARRKDGRSRHPFFWAGFVAVGDWR
jgi:CHAT domain-containing protein